MGLMSAKSNLIKEIFLTREFNLLRQAKHNLISNPTLNDEIMNFSRSKSLDSPNELNEDKLNKLMQHSEAANYINACINMEKLVLSIINDINSAIDINLR